MADDVPTAPKALIQWLKPLIDGTHATEMMLGIASVAVVVWTAGFVVRSLGHKPNRGLVAGMNFAQLAFMGGLVAAFLTPLALQAVAVMFLIQEAWIITSIFFVWRQPFDARTFGQQQMLDIYGLKTASDFYWFFLLQAPYVIAIVCIMLWPTPVVALPLLWLALYGSYQIITSFLYVSADSTTTGSTTPQNAATVQSPSFWQLTALQTSLSNTLGDTGASARFFSGREQDGVEARLTVQLLAESAAMMQQFPSTQSNPQPVSALLALGYLQALLNHRAAFARLFHLIYGVAYQPLTATALLDEIRVVVLYDQALLLGNAAASTSHVQTTGNVTNIVVTDSRLGTTTKTLSIPWLAQTYFEEVNTALLSLISYITNFVPSQVPSQVPSPAPEVSLTDGVDSTTSTTEA